MAYSVDLRSRVIDFIHEGNTQESASIVFKVGTSTIKRWLALYSETGSLEKRALDRSPSKFESEKLNAYIEENPNALLKDITAHFGGSISGAASALKREKITYKKKRFTTASEMKQSAKSSSRNCPKYPRKPT
jgi:putative transposase